MENTIKIPKSHRQYVHALSNHATEEENEKGNLKFATINLILIELSFFLFHIHKNQIHTTTTMTCVGGRK